MRRAARAFTLVELLVALGITAVLAATLLTMVSNALALWERTAGALRMESEARLVLDRLAHDLASAYSRHDDGEWMAVTRSEADVVELRCWVMTASTSGAGDDPATLREVRYHWVAGAGRLYRWESTASAAWARGYVWADDVAAVVPEYLLAERVLGLALTFDDDAGGEIENPAAANGLVRVKVRLTLLSEAGAGRLAAAAAGRSNETTAQIRAQTARDYVRWMEVGGGGW